MFAYWNGYEIDGSATAYNIVVPERQLLSEILRYFISLKVIDRHSEVLVAFDICAKNYLKGKHYTNSNYTLEDIDKICEIIEQPEIQTFCITVNCIHPDKLYHEVRKELYHLSEIRPGNQILNYKNPSVSPFQYGPLLEVSLQINFNNHRITEDYKPEGLVFNRETLVKSMKEKHFTIEFICGPTFIFEYAAYITSKIAERFPEVGIDGGIDCAGGFTDGCTYSCSLYAYERIRLSAETISLTVNTLLNNDIIVPQKRTGMYGHEISPCDKLFLFNLYNMDRWADYFLSKESKAIKGITLGKTEYTPEEYENFVKRAAEIEMIDRVNFMHYCTCCVKIHDQISALTCTKEKGRIYLELRIPPDIRKNVEETLRRYQIGMQ